MEKEVKSEDKDPLLTEKHLMFMKSGHLLSNSNLLFLLAICTAEASLCSLCSMYMSFHFCHGWFSISNKFNESKPTVTDSQHAEG